MDSLRVVDVHQAKTDLSRLIDDAHAGETILLAKAGKPWARLMPCWSRWPSQQHQAGRPSTGPGARTDSGTLRGGIPSFPGLLERIALLEQEPRAFRARLPRAR